MTTHWQCHINLENYLYYYKLNYASDNIAWLNYLLLSKSSSACFVNTLSKFAGLSCQWNKWFHNCSKICFHIACLVVTLWMQLLVYEVALTCSMRLQLLLVPHTTYKTKLMKKESILPCLLVFGDVFKLKQFYCPFFFKQWWNNHQEFFLLIYVSYVGSYSF